jgi:probable rRNA maturation factor
MEPGSSTGPDGARGAASPRRPAGFQAGSVAAQAADVPAFAEDDGTGAALPSPSFAIEVVLDEPGWRRAAPRAVALARRAAAAALAAEGAPEDFGAGMTILLADDRRLRRLNAEHRGKDKPTNVLSFPADMPGHLGDIALALGVTRREAAAAGRRLEAHLAHLVAHGTLHLLGHDHLEAGEARRMERAEARVMARLGLPNPWKSMPATARPGRAAA